MCKGVNMTRTRNVTERDRGYTVTSHVAVEECQEEVIVGVRVATNPDWRSRRSHAAALITPVSTDQHHHHGQQTEH